MAEEGDREGVRREGISIVLTTFADMAAGEAFVRQLVEERLIACGNLVPGILSLYRWQGEIARDEEVMVVMKVATSEVGRLFARAAELHPYDVPELIELPAARVAEAYCRWVIDSTEVSA